MGRETYETDRFAAKASELREAMINVGRVRGLFDPILDALPSLGTLAVLIVGGVRLRQDAVSLPEVISVAFLFSVLAVPVRAIGFVLGELPRAAVGFDRVRNVLTATGEMRYGAGALDGSTGARGGDPLDIRFEHVSFSYASGPTVLTDVTFAVPPGATVALVGPTGSGKSTIAALAARLMDPATGRIVLGGRALTDLSADGARGRGRPRAAGPVRLRRHDRRQRRAGPRRHRRGPRSARRLRSPRPTASSPRYRTASIRASANVAPRCRAANGSG